MWPRRLATAAAILIAAMLVLAAALAVVEPTRYALSNLAVGLVVGSLAGALGILYRPPS